ncbi:MAG: hypothetical protein HS113_15095 [Verrucomicrobiales bacterium]|nr:hypothetical protein [Verrucomicrobiales bacterium]
MATPTASAAAVYEITARVVGGVFDGTIGTGTFSYNDDLIPEFGPFEIGPIEGLRLTLTLFGQTFEETNDVEYDQFPKLYLEERRPTALDFLVDENPGSGFNATSIDKDGVTAFYFVGNLRGAPGDGYEVDLVVIPEPPGGVFAGVTALGLGLFAWLRRRGVGS